MKIVIIGGTGLIGSKLVPLLRSRGHELLQASPSRGVNAVTGEGLQPALAGADIVVDVSNSPSFEDKAVLHFFETGTRNLIAAAKQAGVRHCVAPSVVGTDRPEGSGYFRAKLAADRGFLGEPANGIREVAGPEAAPLADFVGRWLRKQGDTSRIVARADVPYFGALLALRTLVPDDGARIMPTRFDDWLGRAAA
jgi:uncharacterized protein YbjT (DUF2867 family)